jgi:hypothetical protein
MIVQIQYVAYCEEKIFVANSDTIKIGFCKLTPDRRDKKCEFDATMTINLDFKVTRIHAIFMTRNYKKVIDEQGKEKEVKKNRIMVALETEDQ